MAVSPSFTTRLGRFVLRELIGRSGRSMTWLVLDTTVNELKLLCLPRYAVQGSALDLWLESVKQSSRLSYPALLTPREVGIEEGWPFAAYDYDQTLTPLAARLAAQPAPMPLELIEWAIELVHTLAYLHEANTSHLDLGVHHFFLNEHKKLVLLGVGVGRFAAPTQAATAPGSALEATYLTNQRLASQRDLLMLGLLLYAWLAGKPALDEPDIGRCADYVDQEVVRLPWTTPQPIHAGLRAIVNRATERQSRYRYLNARTLLRALEGWRDAHAQDSLGPIDLLRERFNQGGILPGLPGLSARINQLVRMEGQQLEEMTELIVQDPALVFESLRVMNSAQFQTQADARISSVARIVFLLGMQGIKTIANQLLPWPGTLARSTVERAQTLLEQALKKSVIAGLLARTLCPFGISEDEALSAALLQNLGRLLVLYHFPDEAEQIRRLTLASAPALIGQAEASSGMDEHVATSAVLGVDYDALGVSVARFWGLDEHLIQAMQPLALQHPVRQFQDRPAILRALASAANEIAQVGSALAAPQATHFTTIVHRYERALGLNGKEIQEALVQAQQLLATTAKAFRA